MICDRIEEYEIASNHSKKTLVDKKGGSSKYRIYNKSKSTYSIIDFENDVYKNQQNDTKCDYGLKTKESIFYIELKGCNITKGFKQLLATINETERCFTGKNLKVRLIVSRFPSPKRAKQTKEYKDLIKKVGTVKDFDIKQDEYTEVI